MVLLILVIVAPFGAYAQSEDPMLNAEKKTVEAEDKKEQSNEEAHSFDDELLDAEELTAAFDSLENMATTAFEDFQESPADTSRLYIGDVLTEKDKQSIEPERNRKVFIPDPQRALWLSFVLPGGGQVYNRKYWKLPIFYGGFLGCMYAFTWNQQMYMDYSQAYLDIMDDNPDTHSYTTMFPPSYDIESNLSRFQTIFKNRKDRYRRWRDLSTFCFIGVYALSIIDAYVDAHLSIFDISPNLSLHVAPTSIEGPHSNIGLGAALCF